MANLSKRLFRLKWRDIFVCLFVLSGLVAITVIYSLKLNYPPIRDDGLGYYMYLPATFIYHDIGLENSARNKYGEPMYGHVRSLRIFRTLTLHHRKGKFLIIYPIGVALLMLPLFAVAMLIAALTHAPLDGFSWPFQYAAAIGGLCYTAAGIYFLWKVLEKTFSQKTILVAICATVFGTNLFHQATYASGGLSHIYSFFLFCIFLYLVQGIYSEGRLSTFVLTGLVSGLIIVTRFTNVIWLLFGVLYGITSRKDLKERTSFIKRKFFKYACCVASCLAIVLIQLIYWKYITGRFIVYSHRITFFDFSKPHIFNVLFSVRKGLFFWSPVLLLVLLGLFFLRRKAPQFFLPILVFLPLNIYIISSWQCWWYGGSFGHRAFTESIPLFAICFCALYEGVKSSFLKRRLAVAVVVCIILSLWLMLKYWTGVIPFDKTTWKHFSESFFSLK